jgi:uncharacterized membrane protein
MRSPRKLLFAAAIVLSQSAAAVQTAHPCAASHYKIIPLPIHPASINNSGVVAGTTEDHQAATWTEKGGLHEIALPAGFTTAQPLAVNQAEELAGEVTREGSDQPLAFEYSHGKFSPLSEARSKAFAINDAGDIAGQDAERLVLWRKQKPIPLGGCCGGIPHAINNHGQIVGQLNDKQGHYSAFQWDSARGLRSIAPPDSATSVAVALNDAGHVLLKSFTPNAVFLRREGKLTPVLLSSEYSSQPLALNNCDVVVGEFGAASDFNHAFIWDQKNGFRDLNQLIDSGSEWILETALDINDRGEIIGIGDRGSNQDVGFLLVPDAGSGSAKRAKQVTPKYSPPSRQVPTTIEK